MGKSEVGCDCAAIHDDVLEHVQSEIVPDESLNSMAKLFKVFGDIPVYVSCQALNCHEMCVCDLAVLLDMTKISYITSVKGSQGQQPGQISKERKARLLFSGR